MKVNKVKQTIMVSVVLSLFVVGAFAAQPTKVESISPFFTLVAKTNYGGVRPDYLNFLAQHLAKIGINVDVIVQDWPTFVGELVAFRDFDICYVGLGGGIDPDFSGVYDENGSLNLFGYHTDMDYDPVLGTGINEWYIKEGNLIMPPDSEERVQHYWDWQQYFMDKILPLKPTFAPVNYVASWATLDNYNFTYGLRRSWGKMDWSAPHTGQINDDEIVVRDAAWSDLNPLTQDDSSSGAISTLVMDTLVMFDYDLSTWPHLAESYTMINDTTCRIVCRQGIEWGDDPDGLWTNEYFDAEDVFFTIWAWKTVSNEPYTWDWVEKMEIVDQWTLDIYIDGDPGTVENDPYAPFLPSLWTRIFPEHYLNQTQIGDGVTPDVSHPSWNTYSTNAFGCGLFEISSFTEGVETVLTLRDECWWLDPVVTADPALEWDTRFGFGTGWDGLHQYRIRIIPDLQTALLEFEAGKLDVVGCTTYPDRRDAYIADPDFQVQSDTDFSYDFFGYNMRPVRADMGNPDPAPGDPTMTIGLAIRKAVSYAIDRTEINNVIHRGEWTICDHPIYTKLGIWCNPNIIRYNFDLDRAREYMEIAGYSIPVVTTPTPTATEDTPGFTWLLGLASLFVVASASYLILKRRK